MFPEEHQDKFERLRAHFISGLPEREAEIEDLTATLLERGSDPSALENLYLATHKLAGICATYGLTQLGHLAEKAEALLESARLSQPNEAELDQILLATDLVSEELGIVTEAA